MLQKAGMPNVSIGAEVVNPPPITLNGETSRKEADFRNNQQQIWLTTVDG
jgi:hypothetical protein